MPQTTVEKKFFRVRVDKVHQNITAIIFKSFAIAEFQENKEFPKNIMAGGEE